MGAHAHASVPVAFGAIVELQIGSADSRLESGGEAWEPPRLLAVKTSRDN